MTKPTATAVKYLQQKLILTEFFVVAFLQSTALWPCTPQRKHGPLTSRSRLDFILCADLADRTSAFFTATSRRLTFAVDSSWGLTGLTIYRMAARLGEAAVRTIVQSGLGHLVVNLRIKLVLRHAAWIRCDISFLYRTLYGCNAYVL